MRPKEEFYDCCGCYNTIPDDEWSNYLVNKYEGTIYCSVECVTDNLFEAVYIDSYELRLLAELV